MEDVKQLTVEREHGSTIGQLLEFIKYYHGDQKRKYTGEPYWVHPLEVASILKNSGVTGPMITEVALCHDLFEDTACTGDMLYAFMVKVGYEPRAAHRTVIGVNYLTDVYTPDAFPSFNRKERKQMEAKRLSQVPEWVQSIKYADLLSNTTSIVDHDPGFAKIYLEEKDYLLINMIDGDLKLWQLCRKTLVEGRKKLNLVY